MAAVLPLVIRNADAKPHDMEPPTPHSFMKTSSRDRSSMEDPDGTLASVAQCIEQLRQNSSSMQEKENSLKQLLELIDTRENAFSAVGSHSQAVPVLVSLLRSGSLGVKMQAATVLGSLCKENELRVKVLLGGCIPPLLGLLKSSSADSQIASAKTIYAVSQGGAKDHVGSKIFSTEGVVPVLWEQLKKGLKAGNIVDDLLTGALKNLSTSTEGFWSATVQAGGVDILVKLLNNGQPSTQANVCFLLACMMMEDSSVCSRVLAAEATKQLLKLLGPGNEASVRAEAAGALKSLSAQSKDSRKEIANSNGIPALINATIAPSKEFMQGEYAQALQEHAMCALANISGGLSYVISSLGQSLESCTSPAQVADTLGALASALMIYDSKAENSRASDPLEVEETLVKQFKARLPFLVQERTIEALASLYGNSVLSSKLVNSDAKRLLVGLITMATNEVQDELIRSLLFLCKNEGKALDALCFLSRLEGASGIKPAWAVLAEYPNSISPVVSCIADASSVLQDKAIEILSRLCQAQPTVLGDAIACAYGCISSVARRVICSSNAMVKIGGSALLVCAAKVNHQRVVDDLNESKSCVPLIQSFVGMLNASESLHLEDQGDKIAISISRNAEEASKKDEVKKSTLVVSGVNIAIWLLSALASHDDTSKAEIMEAGAIEVLTERISQSFTQFTQIDFKEDSSIWICGLLLAILFQDRDIIRANGTMKAIPVLANLLKSEESANRYFAAQAVASLVCNGSRGTLLSVANSGAPSGLITLLGCADEDIKDLVALSEEFALVRNPDEVALERLFRVDDIRVGATSRKAIPALVDLLKPIPDRPGAPFLALGLLIQLARDCPSNKIVMVESGALEALTKYLSLGPQDATEEAATDLLGILFTTAEICRHESAFGAVGQLIAVLRLGGRGARYSAAKALENLFSADHIRNAESARQSVQPLVEILNTGLEREQHAAIAALVRLLSENPSKALAVADVEMNAVDVLCRILASSCSMELKGDAAELCSVLFGNTRIRSTMAAARCVEPLVSLLVTEFSPAHHSVVRALDKLVDDEQLAELVAAHGAVIPLVGLLYGRNYLLHEAISRALVKLGKDRPSCKMEMVKAGVIESVLDILHEAPDFLCAAFAELLRILTNNATIAKGPSAAKVVEPLFVLLMRPEFGPDGQHSTLQVLVNILEHPQCRSDYTLTSHQAIEPLIPLLDSPASAVQQLAAELLSHLLLEEHLQKDPVIQQVIGPLVRVLGSGIPILQQRAVKALVCIALTWPNEIAKEGGVNELSKVIMNADPSLPHALWESAAVVLSSILQFSSEFFLEVPVVVLVRLLRSGSEGTVLGALNALLVLETDDSTSAGAMAESGAIESLLELLRCHLCEETAARLLEVLLNNVKIRETKATKSAIVPLSQYLLDPQTQGQQARLLATLALGDLFQNETLARSSDAVSACRALVNLLEDQPTEEMKVIAICALQNLVMYSRSNKRAVAEAGGVQVVLDLIGSSETDTSVQAAMFVKLLFSNNTIQEYASSETVRAITAAIEKDLWASGTVNEEYLKALNALFGNFPRLRATEPATLSIPHLVTSLKTGSEATQEAALDALFFLRQAWSACPAEVSRAQSIAAADAIPLLQYLIQSGPPRFQEKSEFLLQCLPGTLVVIIKRGNNMRQSVGNPSVFCKLTLGNTPPRQTKVVSTGPNPEFDESFSWSFESPPKGQKLHISCKNKSKMGKSSFGKVTIQIDRVVMLGAVAGEYTLLPESKSGPSRNLEIEFQWSNKQQME
uniref:C2 domain-containing protein n=1 Tax=Solanum lycopersicum TaxID=4081 RepID=A0A3Q7G5W3_SOLLC